MIDFPPPEPPVAVNSQCIAAAAASYGVPPLALLLIRMQENGKEGTISYNISNGTHDHGVMQINTSNMGRVAAELKVDQAVLINNECASIFGAAFLLRQHLTRNKGDIWESLGDYHSGNEPYHSTYLGHIRRHYSRVTTRYQPYVDWLNQLTESDTKTLENFQPGPLVTFHGVAIGSSIADTGVNTAYSTKPYVNPYIKVVTTVEPAGVEPQASAGAAPVVRFGGTTADDDAPGIAHLRGAAAVSGAR